MNSDQKGKNIKQIRHQNVLESLKDIGASTANSLKKDVLRSQDFLDQIMGYNKGSFSGELSPGESLEMGDVYSGKHEDEVRLKKQLAHERKLQQEEKILIEQKGNELRLQLQALMKEIAVLVENTNDLTKEVELAAMQAPIEPGVYHVIFFEKLLEFIKSFRKKIEDATIWLYATNKRAQKMNYWSKYKKHGGKFFLSADHYLTRSAG